MVANKEDLISSSPRVGRLSWGLKTLPSRPLPPYSTKVEAQRDGATCLYPPSSQLFDRSAYLALLHIHLCESMDFTVKEGGRWFWGNIPISYARYIPSHPFLHNNSDCPFFRFLFLPESCSPASRIQDTQIHDIPIDVLVRFIRATKPTTKKKHFFTLNTETSFPSLCVCITTESLCVSRRERWMVRTILLKSRI